MFLASAPPVRWMRTPWSMLSCPATWKIHVSSAVPSRTASALNPTPVLNLYRPGARVWFPRLPMWRLTKSGGVRPAASTVAVCMFEMAVVSFDGVGTAKSAAYSAPAWVEVANSRDSSRVRLKPVSPPWATGETPISPVTTEGGTVLTPALARMVQSSAVPSRTGAGPRGACTMGMAFERLRPAVAVATSVSSTKPRVAVDMVRAGRRLFDSKQRNTRSETRFFSALSMTSSAPWH
mmetsp:Transcript_38178/g.61126  ORF Transcript_38178/g.61126 Transcript_38178/m.61126 type:complete len:236 (+) Transcript_38178:154-861(+)